jgi:mono/diheme cytochrome c family protein
LRAGPVLAVALAVLSAPAAARNDAAAARNFLMHCAGCHHADGHGLPQNGIPDLALSGPLAGSAEGRRFLIQVPGVAQSRLGDGELADMLNWLLDRFSRAGLPAGFQPYDAGEIVRARAEPVHDPVARRAAIVTRLPPLPSIPSSAADRPY